ncbi:hypothetical protein GPK34_03605 [Secundilactobacillus kimchicus]|uniref:hypothetical protein n=1 Tax=Secundilactobacillus kimchicus TaxID=528209 RepID=UPI001C01BD22|nr:hypothetical protein [Secundilactobacillus kimchicus]MBT9671115.1 hypothetical protein [Secundilactobacillus kimchicus]
MDNFGSRYNMKYQKDLAEKAQRKTFEKRVPKKAARVLFSQLNSASVEKDVENAWRSIFENFFIKLRPKSSGERFVMSSPYNTDGFIVDESGSLLFSLRLLMEFKQGTDLTKSSDRARIVAQIIHYMKKFEQNGVGLPNIVVGADENQAFVLVASNFQKYLQKDYKWDIAPSAAYKEDLELMKDLALDANLSVFPFQFVDGNFLSKYSSLVDLFETIESITQADADENNVYKVKVSPATIVGMFDEFQTVAFKQSVSATDAVNIFVQLLTGKSSDDYYLLPNNHNMLHLPGDKKVSVYGSKVEAFFNHYDRNFTADQIDELTAIADRLIQATERRYKGDFWTPSIWAHKADQIMSQVFGEEYKKDSIIWDSAAGVRNLTRDFNYNELFISTYHDGEICLGEGYNTEAKAVFQYDFLNDDVFLTPEANTDPNDWKLPKTLFDALQEASKSNKRVIFFTNPPYGTANNVNANGTHKAGIAKNAINEIMKGQDYGKASQQLYAQFFVRIMKLVEDFNLTNVGIGFFTNSRFFSGGEYWEKFNQKFFSMFEFIQGNIFSAGEFSDTSANWPITFSVYKLRKNSEPFNGNFEAEFDVEESYLQENNTVAIRSVGKHRTRMVDPKESLSKWVRSIENNSLELPLPYPQLSSALSESKGKKPSGKLIQGSLGYMVSNSNNVGEGTFNGGVWVVTGSAYKGHGFNVTRENFDRSVVNFAARRSISANYVNAQDNYKFPQVKGEKYTEFVNDSLIYSLFDGESYQAAYRNPNWSNTNEPGKWANQWFWLGVEKVRQCALSKNQRDIYEDARTDSDRFVSKELETRILSSEAKAVLDAATSVWMDTLEYRSVLNDEDSSLYLNAWDAGWYQIKKLEQKFKSEHYVLFKSAFQNLSHKIEKMVYEFDMLIK